MLNTENESLSINTERSFSARAVTAVSTLERVQHSHLPRRSRSCRSGSSPAQRRTRWRHAFLRKSCVIQLSSVSIRYQFSSSRCSSQLRGVRGSITCFVTREGGTSSKLKQSLVSRIVICTVLAFSKIMRRSRVQQGKCAHPMLLSRQFNGRLSPMDLSRPSAFAAANAPEASLESREEDGSSVQDSLQRNILRTQAPDGLL